MYIAYFFIFLLCKTSLENSVNIARDGTLKKNKNV